MDQRVVGLSLFLVLAAFNTTALHAQQGPESLIPEFPPDREVCYGRTYEKAHLAAHPHQKVQSFFLFRSLTDDAMSETQPRTPDAVAKENVEWERTTRAENSTLEGTNAGRASLDVLVRFRNQPTVYKQSVECRKLQGKGFTCGVDCDGGSFSAEPDGNSILIRQSQSGLRLQSGCTSGDESAPEVRLQSGKEDKSFRLSRLPMSACHASRDAARPEWIRPGVEPLRTRLATATRLCLRNAEALPAALAQRFSRISVESLGPMVSRGERADADNEPEFKLRVIATAHNGTPVSRVLDCRADEYSFDCSSESAGLRLTTAPGGAATVRERFYEGGEITRLFGLRSAKLRPIAFAPATCQAQ